MDLIQELKKQADIIRNKSAYYGKIEIKPITVGQLIAISPYLAQIQIEGEIKTPEDFHEKVVPQLTNFTDPLRAIFDELFECDFDNLLPIDLYNLLGITLSQIDTGNFTKAITSVELLSRNQREDLMALQRELKSSTR